MGYGSIGRVSELRWNWSRERFGARETWPTDILEPRWGLGKADTRINVAVQTWRSRLGVWGGKDILMSR